MIENGLSSYGNGMLSPDGSVFLDAKLSGGILGAFMSRNFYRTWERRGDRALMRRARATLDCWVPSTLTHWCGLYMMDEVFGATLGFDEKHVRPLTRPPARRATVDFVFHVPVRCLRPEMISVLEMLHS